MNQLNTILKFIQLHDLQRQSNQSSSGGSGGGYSKSTSATSPYQSQLYDSWKTEWDGAYYDQRDHFRLDEGSCKIVLIKLVKQDNFFPQHCKLQSNI